MKDKEILVKKLIYRKIIEITLTQTIIITLQISDRHIWNIQISNTCILNTFHNIKIVLNYPIRNNARNVIEIHYNSNCKILYATKIAFSPILNWIMLKYFVELYIFLIRNSFKSSESHSSFIGSIFFFKLI